MSNFYRLTDEPMERLKQFFPKSHGKSRVDDRRVLSGIIFIDRNALLKCDAPKEYGPAKILYNRCKRWSDNRVLVLILILILISLAAESAERKTIIIQAAHLKAHRTASSLGVKKRGGRGRQIGRTKGDMSTKLHGVAYAKGRPNGFFISARLVSDYFGAAALLRSLPKLGWLLADQGYDADWFREALKHKGIKICIQDRNYRKKAVKYDIDVTRTQPHQDNVRPPNAMAGASQTDTTVPESVLLRNHARHNRLVLNVKLNEPGALSQIIKTQLQVASRRAIIPGTLPRQTWHPSKLELRIATA